MSKVLYTCEAGKTLIQEHDGSCVIAWDKRYRDEGDFIIEVPDDCVTYDSDEQCYTVCNLERVDILGRYTKNYLTISQ